MYFTACRCEQLVMPSQLETVKAKPGILAIIDELEKITPLLKEVGRIAGLMGLCAKTLFDYSSLVHCYMHF